MDKVVIGLLGGLGGVLLAEAFTMIRRRLDNMVPHDRFIAARYEACDRMRRIVPRLSSMALSVAAGIGLGAVSEDSQSEYGNLLDEFYLSMVDGGIYFNKKISTALRELHIEALLISLWQRGFHDGDKLIFPKESLIRATNKIADMKDVLTELFAAEMKSRT